MSAAPRRSEFASNSLEVAQEILRSSRYGHLATVSRAGLPEIRPLNYALGENTAYFHTSPKGDLAGWGGRAACLSVEDTLCWLPSYWRNQELACPATTYYRSLQARGVLRRVESPAEKARAMQALMQRYQPEGGHRPLTDEVYRGPLDALSVLALPLEEVQCKLKFGQHLTPGLRVAMVEALVDRGGPGDMACAQAIRRYNFDLPGGDGWTFDSTLVDAVQIWELLRATYWGHRRSRQGVEQQRDQAWLILARIEQGRVQAYARLHRVDARTAFLYDVIVEAGQRGRGLGKELLARLLDHPKVALVERIFLDTRDAMGLYEQYGFRSICRGQSGSTTMLWER